MMMAQQAGLPMNGLDLHSRISNNRRGFPFGFWHIWTAAAIVTSRVGLACIKAITW